MLRHLLHILCSLWLAALLLFGGTPKDFIHQFAGHQDTIHERNYGHNGPIAEQSHHHCSFLDFQLLPFAEGFKMPLLQFAKCADYESYSVLVSSRFLTADVRVVSLRGPPVVLA